MKVLIIEDELPAAQKLERNLHRYDPAIEVVGRLDSVHKAVSWLGNPGHQADLIFMDIQLADGSSFEIFRQAHVRKPVIFTTAHDGHALEAFRVSGIDYLLKPISFEALSDSLNRFDQLKQSLASAPAPENALKELSQALSLLHKKQFKNRFMVRVGEHIQSIPAEQVALFYSEERVVFLISQSKRYLIDYKLEDLEEALDPALFFRVNRSFIVGINSIKEVVLVSSSRLKIQLNFPFDKEIIVSRERVNQFKEWFNG